MTSTAVIGSLKVSLLQIPFRTRFSHASSSRNYGESLWVEIHGQGITGYGEGCPRSYVTGENLADAIAWVEKCSPEILHEIRDFSTLAAWVEARQAEIDEHPSAWCAVELALLDWLGRREGRSLENLLSLPPLSGTLHYSAVLGDSSAEIFCNQTQQYIRAGFADFKIKLSGDLAKDSAKLGCLKGLGGIRLRADANNLFEGADQVIEYLLRLGYGWWAIEEPVATRNYQALQQIASKLDIRVILDESFTLRQDIELLPGDARLWIPNFRISKLGGLLRALSLVSKAKALGHEIIIGAHVGETSVLTRAALPLALAAGGSLLGMEGAFGTHLLEQDVCSPPLMFGAGGRLELNELPCADRPGLGLNMMGAGWLSPRP